ncbi:MAG TPA: NupC/NupG family nucleoside CNT transporter [Myxococcales bacterium]|nr:NupC/NupG family nucleoside CNT transporter [Myxococcales bacterium]HIN86356.1 NupC/NupG family nucleoside CNT transporter [Myxococcales bacterium]
MRKSRRWLLLSLVLLVGLVTVDVLDATAKNEPTPDTQEQVTKKTTTPISLKSLSNRAEPTTLSQRLISFLGIPALILIAFLLSRNRGAIRWRPVLWGIGLQIAFGLVVLSPQVGGFLFDVVNQSVTRLLSFSEAGADFLFQTLDQHEITTVNPATGLKTTQSYVGTISPPLKTLAFWVLPTIIFFSALMNILYHLGIMQWLVRGTAFVMRKTMGTSGSESLSAAANIFVGQTEAPLVVKPFVKGMTESELNAIMVGGFATVAGGVLAAYVGFLHKTIPDIAGHLVMASIMSAPAALAVAKILIPEDQISETAGGAEFAVDRPDVNLIEAMSRGATEGLTLAVNVAAMLIAFVAMIALVNYLFLLVGGLFGMELSLEMLLGYLFAPIAWVMGVPGDECILVGRLLGEKMVLTEFIAYIHLGENLSGPSPMSYRSAVITSYALCGFANFASIGIQIGGIGGIAPERRKDLARLGILAMIGGTLAAFMTATIAGIIL